MEENTKDLSDYLSAFKRRRSAIAATFLVIFTLGVIIALVWPPTYESSATILIEEQEVPRELVQSTVTSYAAQRIQMISQRVMTRANLMELIEKYGLYRDELERQTTEEVLASMREDIGVETISAEVIDPRTGRPMPATIAFELSFKGENPDQVQKVASELTNLYLNENLKERTSQAAQSLAFLSGEANRLKRRIGSLESELSAFKEQHLHSLPEQAQLTTQLMDRTERQLDDVDNQISALEDRKFYLEGQLGQIEPHGQNVEMNPAARLKALRTQYFALSARYSPDHPDVRRLQREIESLEQETGLGPDRASLLEERDRLQTELASLREKYAPEHPDVVKLQKTVDELNAQIAQTPETPPAQRAPDNPAYVTLQSQLESTLNDIRAQEAKKLQLEADLKKYEQRLAAAPEVEREYRAMQRELQNAVAKYQEITAKEMQAQVAQQLESESKGERFTLIDPAALPEEPVSPNRPAIVFLSFVLALGSGFGLAAVAESLDHTIRGARGVANTLQVMPLAAIPYQRTEGETRKRRNRKWKVLGGTAVAVLIAVLAVHFFMSPLDVLWFRILRKAGDMTGMDFIG
ncbi:chain-length determining protein [Thiohalobacter sp. COW1]|uniref:GumC family protein n=1 Tax=Thiohalobacter sp. COW1 TaxID=2795687 RepID=UPI00191607B5|nr:Wzz/FepE/Etk N-terminal domain-containing protein [Thiohalobacter sp. COW1]BCO31801.1 chain-length determining protein [Thiohalobacter sp. COW1]